MVIISLTTGRGIRCAINGAKVGKRKRNGGINGGGGNGEGGGGGGPYSQGNASVSVLAG